MSGSDSETLWPGNKKGIKQRKWDKAAEEEGNTGLNTRGDDQTHLRDKTGGRDAAAFQNKMGTTDWPRQTDDGHSDSDTNSLGDKYHCDSDPALKMVLVLMGTDRI